MQVLYNLYPIVTLNECGTNISAGILQSIVHTSVGTYSAVSSPLFYAKELETRLEKQGEKLEWADINRDIRALQEVEVDIRGKKMYLRTDLRGVCHTVLQAAGVAAPPTVRE